MLVEINRNYSDVAHEFGASHIIGTFLYGSQNYNLSTVTSDVDTRTLIIPSFNDIVLSNKEVAIEKCLSDGSHSNIEDIRHFVRALRKQNICFLEILFTDYFKINPQYKSIWDKLVEHREEIARMSPDRFVYAIMGMSAQQYAKVRHSSLTNKVNKLGYNGKALAMLLRLEYVLERYIAGLPFRDCLVVDTHTQDRILTYKTTETIPLATAVRESDRAYRNIESIYNNLFKLSDAQLENKDIMSFINFVVGEFIQSSLLKEIAFIT